METHEHRLKRLRIRAWRRGMKEMDLILGTFVDQQLRALGAADLDALEALMAENDTDIYPWFTGLAETPPEHVEILQKIKAAVKLH
ncbi:MAG TPA: succinate dehydrogenase assembly factor 2 [Rhodobacteraceae bacterium]|nr:succinate dehydrogenase assembly factor 2 [Paracoccaceae bacterium]